MRHKLTFATGFALGYTFGARAGRQRYDQIVAFLRAAAENPAVQEAAGVLQQQAAEMFERAGRAVRDQMAQAVGHGAAPAATAYPQSAFAASGAGPSANGGPHPG